MPRHLVDGTEPGAAGVSALARRALALRGGAKPRRHDGKRLGAVFFNSSLRTRMSMEAACGALGIQPLTLSPGQDAWKLEIRDGVVMNGDEAEHITEAVKVLAEYADALAVRAFAGLTDLDYDRADPVIAAFIKHAGVPVINMESARYHPLQGLADTATWMSRFGEDLRGVPLTITWAPHPRTLPLAVVQQDLLSSSLMGMDVTLAHPEGFDVDPEILERATAQAQAAGGKLRVTNDQDGAMKGARVVLAKNWSGFSGYADRAAETKRRATLGDWTVTPEKLALTQDAGFMHCLPVRRNVVVSDAVLDGSASWVIEQAGLRLWTAMALLEGLWEEGPWSV